MINKTRASLDGHAFHHAWAVRSALELLPPDASLSAIAIEGFSEEDSASVSGPSVEVADLVRYHGGRSVLTSHRVEVAQFKYSVADRDTPVRAADITKTIAKFVATELQLSEVHGVVSVPSKVQYEFATNRPICPGLLNAIDACIRGQTALGDTKAQLDRLIEATNDARLDRADFLRRLSLCGRRGSVTEVERSARRTLASWSSATDPMTQIRHLQLQQMVRDKAGMAGEGANLVDRVAVLAELKLEHERDLYPSPAAFPPVDKPLRRSVLDQVSAMALAAGAPLLVHGAGGSGKTVLMQAAASELAATHHVICFDGFGAGKWRDPSDGRHRPEKTLLHLANLLAAAGLCDLLLPVSDQTDLMRAFRERLEQSVRSLREGSDKKGLVLVLDAIDHAGIQARKTSTTSFAQLVLKTLWVTPIDGVGVVASCRTERIADAVGECDYREIAVPPLTEVEASAIVTMRDPAATTHEIAALVGRCGGNPRFLDTLLSEGRPYETLTSTATTVDAGELVDLLQERIRRARVAALERGASESELEVLFAGLAILPPPVPVEELAQAYGLTNEAVESLIADLSPLLERTPYGVMFRDEPTETLISSISDGNLAAQRRVVGFLRARQDRSQFAARALPIVLTALGEIDELVTLAFDARMPTEMSKAGHREIRLSRLTSAMHGCAQVGRNDDLLRLLLEVSSVVSGRGRSDRYLYEHPDLVAMSGDHEAFRQLSDNSVGWPGGKHAGLAIATWMVNDTAESRRHSRRSIDWHNWANSDPQGKDAFENKASTQFDLVGFLYVEGLAGKDIRVVEWLSDQSNDESAKSLATLLGLLERHQAFSENGHRSYRRTFGRLSRCRSTHLPLWAVALRHSENAPSMRRRLVRGLAHAVKKCGKGCWPSRLMTLSAISALSLAMRPEAKAIFAATGAVRPREYDFGSYWPQDREVETFVLHVGVSAAINRRDPRLQDLVPEEMLELVPRSYRQGSSQAFSDELGKRLSEDHAGRARTGSRKPHPFNYEKASRLRNVLAHRIEPLIERVRAIQSILSAGPNELQQVACDALADLDRAVDRTSGYPYRDSKSYLAKIGFWSIFNVLDAMGQLTLAGPGLIDFLKRQPSFHYPYLIEVVERLSRQPELHDLALELAQHTCQVVDSDSETESKISGLGSLARAISLASVDEAKYYFQKGLALADAVGSGDYERTHYLVEIASAYQGEELEPRASYELGRIVELNMQEPSKFPWTQFGKATAAVMGLDALALTSRLDDRDVVELNLSLPPLITALVATGKLPVDIGVSLIGLAEPRSTWTWDLASFASACLPNLALEKREWLFETILLELDRTERLTPGRECVRRLHESASAVLPATSRSRRRIEELDRLRSREEDSSYIHRTPRPQIDLVNADIADPAGIDDAILSRIDGDEISPRDVLNELMERVRTTKDRLALVRSIVQSNAVDLEEKLFSLEEPLKRWSVLSRSMAEALPALGLLLAEKHASELMREFWRSGYTWRRLRDTFHSDPARVVQRVVVTLSSIARNVSGDGWLGLAAKLIGSASSGGMKSALDQYLHTAGQLIPDAAGDGPWSSKLSVSGEAIDSVVASMIWRRLGSHRAADRWRAVHTVRRLAASNRDDVIDRLIDLSTRLPPTQGAFSDARLPFYDFHAQLWLLIALAEVARLNSAVIMRHRDRLESIAFDTGFPHVAMRAFASRCLVQCLGILNKEDAAALDARLCLVNATPFPPGEDPSHHDIYAGRPKDVAEPSSIFHLDYDFRKYEVARVMRLFDVGAWSVEDKVTAWVHRWDPSAKGMYECSRVTRDAIDDESTWSGGSVPKVDRYGGYLGWHALQLVAGELLASRPLSASEWYESPWSAFVRESTLTRADGCWLAMQTDLLPIDTGQPLDVPDADTPGLDVEDQLSLMPLLGFDLSGALSDALVVEGNWKLRNEVSIDVATVLASPADARAAAYAVLSETKFHQWLPHRANDLEWGATPTAHSLTAWLDSMRTDGRGLDALDPYASSTAGERTKPADWLVEDEALRCLDSVGREWVTRKGTRAFQAEAWGVEGGRGENHWSESGVRLTSNKAFLRDLLRKRGQVLLGRIQAQRYLKGRRDQPESSGRFTHRSMVFIVDENGAIWVPSHIPLSVRKTISSLAQGDHASFSARFAAIKTCRYPCR